ncbi:hypothetical protein [Mycobacteroides abscessus]|uniref:hypothetical protein n=1 Tax=Mycobacteroides abscessus TaxID=36809 RepID=UPI002105E225|nr:hypothetical protein [Mycobacteroides abscessus]
MSPNTLRYGDRVVQAFQYDGTQECAARIAAAFDLSVVQQAPRAVVFAVPPELNFSPGEYYDLDTREIAVLAQGWVWLDRDDQMIGCEWDDYVRGHFSVDVAHTRGNSQQ